MSKRKLGLAALVLVCVAASVLAVTATKGSAKSTAAYKVAWIYVGPHNDHYRQVTPLGMLGGRVVVTMHVVLIIATDLVGKMH